MDTTTTQTPGAAAAMMGPITTAHLILIAVLAVLTVMMVVWGVRLKARRKAAEAAAEERREDAPAQHEGDANSAATLAEPAPPPVTPPIAAMEAVPSAAPHDPGDTSQDLTRLKGLGPKLAAQLAERGLTRIEQIAALSPAEAAALDGELGSFSGRLTRDRWVEQARLLAAGDTHGYEAEFGRLGG